MKFISLKHLFLIGTLFLQTACGSDSSNDLTEKSYGVSGVITDLEDQGIEKVKVFFTSDEFVETNTSGKWKISNLTGIHNITPKDNRYSFTPSTIKVNDNKTDVNFAAISQNTSSSNVNIKKIIKWIEAQQNQNGLIESSENSDFVSLYDNALCAMVFMLNKDFKRAEAIFNFFNDRIDSELKAGPGGFHWFRNAAGEPYDNRWIGDNAWLLIALNNYKQMTNKSTYDVLSFELELWLRSLQDSDGGLFSGYTEKGDLISYKITEGIIDAFNAVDGYDNFHTKILDFLKKERWDTTDKALVAWPNNSQYKYSIDNQTWAYLLFEDFPVSVLSLARQRLLATQIATVTNTSITGYDIDEDKDAVFIEGIGQMAVAYQYAGLEKESNNELAEMEKVFVNSSLHSGSGGFPYTANLKGTFIEKTLYWEGADTEIAVSTGAWYFFTVNKFNPFEVNRYKIIPEKHKFWFL